MPVARFQMPDGRIARYEVPDGTTPEQAQSMISQSLGGQASDTAERIANDPISQSARASAKPTFGEDLAKQSLLTARYGLEGTGLGTLADKFGLPSPQTPTERVIGDVARTVAGTAALSSAAGQIAPMLKGLPRSIAELFASSPSAQMLSAGAAGGSGGLARESGAGPIGQTAASLAGGIAVPVAIQAASGLGSKLADMGRTIGASYGNKSAIDTLAKEAAVKIAGDTRQQQIDALQRAPTYVPGAAPTAAEAIAGSQIGSPTQFGGGTIRLQKDLSGAVGAEDILPSKLREQKTAIDSYIQGIRNQTAPIREAALTSANAQGGVPTASIFSNIDTQLSTPGIRASDVVKKALGAVETKIKSIADQSGYVNAEDLYTVRKELGNLIQGAQKETSNWDKKLAGGLERNLQKAIDEAIINAELKSSGGSVTNWQKYLDTFSGGMRNVENTLARQKEAKLIAAGVKTSNVGNITGSAQPRIPNLLSRPAMIANWALKFIANDASTPVMRRLAEKMTDPQEYAKMLALPESSTTGQMARDIARQAAVASIVYQGQQPQ